MCSQMNPSRHQFGKKHIQIKRVCAINIKFVRNIDVWLYAQ